MYTPTSGGIQTCVPCSSCRRGQYVNQTCTAHSDTVCEKCPVGTYSTVDSDGCKPCTDCKPGRYIRRKCKGSRDRKCVKCRKRAYSRDKNSVRCTACQPCKLYEDVVNKCSFTHDYKCGDCKRDYFRDLSTGECLPCSFCYPGQTYVIDECFRKLGHSQYVCNPTHYRRMEPADNDSIVEDGNHFTAENNVLAYDTDILVLMVIALSVLLLSVVILSVLFCAIHKSYIIQKCFRAVRDHRFTKSSLAVYPSTNLSFHESKDDVRMVSIVCTASNEGTQTCVSERDSGYITNMLSENEEDSNSKQKVGLDIEACPSKCEMNLGLMNGLMCPERNMETVEYTDSHSDTMTEQNITGMVNNVAAHAEPDPTYGKRNGIPHETDHRPVERAVDRDYGHKGQSRGTKTARPPVGADNVCGQIPSSDVPQVHREVLNVKKTRKKSKKKAVWSSVSAEYPYFANNVYAPLVYNTY